MSPYLATGDTELGNIGAIERSQAMKIEGKKLLSGQRFCLAGEFSIPSRDELIMLLTLGGGTVAQEAGQSSVIISEQGEGGHVAVSKFLDYVSIFKPTPLQTWDGSVVIDDDDDSYGTPLF